MNRVTLNRQGGPNGHVAKVLAQGRRHRSWLAPLILALWTLFVWGGRLRNLVTSDLAATDGLAAVNRWSLVGSLIFVSMAIAVLGALSLKRPRVLSTMGTALVVLTVAVWSFRGIAIAAADHSAGFVAIHTALAVVSIGLAAWTFKRVRLSELL